MPQHTARPSAAGDFAEWTPRNVSGPPLDNYASVASGSSNQYVDASLLGKRDRHVPESLPVAAATVARVTMVAFVSGDDVGEVQLVLRLGGVESSGTAFIPPSGGYDGFQAEFLLAPGGLPWTVARRNAVQFGYDCSKAPSGDALGVDECSLVTDYETATETVETEQAARTVNVRGSAAIPSVAGAASVSPVEGSAAVARVAGLSAVASVPGSARVVPIRGTAPDA